MVGRIYVSYFVKNGLTNIYHCVGGEYSLWNTGLIVFKELNLVKVWNTLKTQLILQLALDRFCPKYFKWVYRKIFLKFIFNFLK